MQTDRVIQDYKDRIKETRLENLKEEKSLCDSLLAYSLRTGNRYGEGVAYTYLCDYYIVLHDVEQSAKWLKTALEHSQNFQFEDLQTEIFNFYGIYSNYIHDDMAAFEYFLKALELAQKLDNKELQSRLYNNIAASFHNKKDYETALLYYRQAYKILTVFCREASSRHYQLFLLQNLINCSITMEDSEGVESYLEEMEVLFEEYPQLREDPSNPYQEAVILYYRGSEEEAFAILEDLLRWEGEDPLDAYNIIELYPVIFDLLIKRKEKALSWKVLKSLSRFLEAESPQDKQESKALAIRFFQTFEMETELREAYRAYYLASREALDSIAKNRIDAMKEKLHSFEVQQELKELQRLTYTDALCGLYNRRYYSEFLEKVMVDPKVRTLGIIIVDIDCFKDYNDRYGHSMGDEVLEKVAQCLEAFKSECITPCRYGGDEFACVCVNVARAEILSYLENVRSRLASLKIPNAGSSEEGHLTISCGYSIRPNSGRVNALRLFHEADEALYRAKSMGRNRFCGYDETDS